VAEDWRRLHNEELHKLYTSPNIIRVIKSMRMGWWECGTHWGKRRVNRPLRRPRRRWCDNIRTDLRFIGWEVVEWIYLAQDKDQWYAFVNTVINLPVS
jgi:hypothetical protein